MKTLFYQRLTASWVLLWAAGLGPAVAQSASEASPFAGIDSSIETLSRITGLRPLHKVRSDTLTKAELRKYLDQRVKEELKPEEIRAQELTLKMFGLVPASFDLRTTTVDLLTEQAAAFYDYRQKKLYLMAGSDPSTEGMFVFHELAHALADQHFNLAKFIRKGNTDDSSLARMAVMEGQATWLMYEYLAEKSGQSLRTAPAFLDAFTKGGAEQTSDQYPVLRDAPLYMRASLLFPYTQGLLFQNALVQKLGNGGFSRPFRDPPSSTQQILHPETYLAGAKATHPPLPLFSRRRHWKTLSEGTVGEFDHAVLLQQYAGKKDAERIAPKWRGGEYLLLENKREGTTALLYSSEWENAEAAGQMFAAYRKILQGKWKSVRWIKESPEELTGVGDSGYFRLSWVGSQISCAEGLPGETGAAPSH